MTLFQTNSGTATVEDFIAGETARNLGAMAKGFVSVLAGGVFLAAIAAATSLLPFPDNMTGLSAPAESPTLVRNDEADPCAGQDWPYLSAKCLSKVNGRRISPPDRLIVHEQMPERIRQQAHKVVTAHVPYQVADTGTTTAQ